jgi:hypothetical protein
MDDMTVISLMTQLAAAQAEIKQLKAERERILGTVAEGTSRLIELAQRNKAALEAAQRNVERYTDQFEREGSISPDEVLPALLAFAEHAAVAAEGGREAFEVARAVLGVLSASAALKE